MGNGTTSKEVAMDFMEAAILNPPTKKDLMEEYEDLKDEITYYQYKIQKADKKDRKKRKKKMKKGEGCFLSSSKPFKARKKVLKKIKRGGLLDRFLAFIATHSKTIKAIGRMIAKLICMILNLDSIKRVISKTWMDRLDYVYNIAVNL